jgi:hypothetical protein
VALAIAWVIGRGAAEQRGNVNVDVAAHYEPPSSEFPRPTQTAVNNNAIMRMGLVGDLEGKAVAYASEAERLVADGQFRLDRSLEQMATLLHVHPGSIADPRSPGQIDPNAELFRAQAGTLAENAKVISHRQRAQQVRAGRRPSAVYGIWVITRYSFTLNRLKHPTDDVRAAAEIMPKPGDGVRAVAVNRLECDDGRIPLWPGMLPLEPLQNVAEETAGSP